MENLKLFVESSLQLPAFFVVFRRIETTWVVGSRAVTRWWYNAVCLFYFIVSRYLEVFRFKLNSHIPPSTSQLLGWYQIILLGDRGCVWRVNDLLSRVAVDRAETVFQLPELKGLNPQLFSPPPNTLSNYILDGVIYILYKYDLHHNFNWAPIVSLPLPSQLIFHNSNTGVEPATLPSLVRRATVTPVSYTHLTLPTNREV